MALDHATLLSFLISANQN